VAEQMARVRRLDVLLRVGLARVPAPQEPPLRLRQRPTRCGVPMGSRYRGIPWSAYPRMQGELHYPRALDLRSRAVVGSAPSAIWASRS